MATDKTTPSTTSAPAAVVKAPRAKRVQKSLAERTKDQLSMAALRGKMTIEELQVLEAHCAKLRGLLA